MIVIEGQVRIDFMKLAVEGGGAHNAGKTVIEESRRPDELPAFIDLDVGAE